MKNIERPEVIRAFAKFFRDNDICSYDFSNENDCDKCALLPICDEEITYEKLFQWLNSEYIEPHHWELWELEVMKRFPKYITGLYHSDTETIVLVKGEKTNFITVDFPSLKLHEAIEVDAELERNGMHR